MYILQLMNPKLYAVAEPCNQSYFIRLKMKT